MDSVYNVIYSGQLQDDANLEEVVQKFAKMTKKPVEKVRPLLSSGKPLMIKKGVSEAQAKVCFARLAHKMPVRVRLVKRRTV